MPTRSSIANRKLQIAIFVLSLTTCCLLLLTSHSSPVYSISPLEQAQNDYSFQLSKYQDAKAKFDNTRANYQTYQTAIAKSDLYRQTKDYFAQICDLYISYFLLVNERANSVNWDHSSYKKDDQSKLVADELASIRNIKSQAQNTQKLEDYNEQFKNLKANIQSSGLPIANSVLKTTDVVQIEETAAIFFQNADALDKYALSKISDNNKPLYNDWKSQIDTYKQTIQKEVDADKSYLKLHTSPNDPQTATFKPDNQNAQNILNQPIGKLTEILKYL